MVLLFQLCGPVIVDIIIVPGYHLLEMGYHDLDLRFAVEWNLYGFDIVDEGVFGTEVVVAVLGDDCGIAKFLHSGLSLVTPLAIDDNPGTDPFIAELLQLADIALGNGHVLVRVNATTPFEWRDGHCRLGFRIVGVGVFIVGVGECQFLTVSHYKETDTISESI